MVAACGGSVSVSGAGAMNRFRWTGPLPADLDGSGVHLLHPVPAERWPYGPPDAHQDCCLLHTGGLFCDCWASTEDDETDEEEPL